MKLHSVRPRYLLGVVLIGALATLVTPVKAEGGRFVVIAGGRSAGEKWRVLVARDGNRKGICLVAVIINQEENARCSAPSVRRGSSRTAVLNNGNGRPKLTVVAGAFNLGVRRVEAVGVNGKRSNLRLRKVRTAPSNQASVTRYRYIAFAVDGPWCVSELVTRNSKGNALWRAEATDFLPYDVGSMCSA
jgi:hypothetical protein